MKKQSHILKLSIALILFGTIFLFMTFFSNGLIFERIIFILTAVFLYIIAGVFMYLYFSAKKNINIFLYDESTKTRRNVEELQFRDICNVLDRFIPIYVYKKSGDGWFEKNVSSKIAKGNSTLTKLVYLRLLYIWIEDSDSDFVNEDECLTKEDVEYIVEYMEEMGENEISEKLRYINTVYGENTVELKMFFESQKEHIENLIMESVKKNLRRF